MIIGTSAAFWPFTKVSTAQTVKLIKEKIPQFSGCFRFPPGEGSEKWFYDDPKNRADLEGFIELCIAFNAPAILVIDGNNMLMNPIDSAIWKRSLNSHISMVRRVREAGVQIAKVSLGNELYSEDAFTGWPKPYTVTSAARYNNIQTAFGKYYQWTEFMKFQLLPMITEEKTYAYCWGTDMNAKDKEWNRLVLTQRIQERWMCVDAHIYPDLSIGANVATLFSKRLGRAKNTDYEIIIGECNTYAGFTGVAPNPTIIENGLKVGYFGSQTHRKNELAYAAEAEKWGITFLCFHKLGGFLENPNLYNHIVIAA